MLTFQNFVDALMNMYCLYFNALDTGYYKEIPLLQSGYVGLAGAL